MEFELKSCMHKIISKKNFNGGLIPCCIKYKSLFITASTIATDISLVCLLKEEKTDKSQ